MNMHDQTDGWWSRELVEIINTFLIKFKELISSNGRNAEQDISKKKYRAVSKRNFRNDLGFSYQTHAHSTNRFIINNDDKLGGMWNHSLKS